MQQTLSTQSSQGSFKEVREKDILSTALGNKEHPGRTRGCGLYVIWRDAFQHDAEAYRSQNRSKAERGEQLKEEIRAQISAQFQGQITLLQEQMNQLINQSQATPVILGASPPQHRSSVASTPALSELGDV